MKRDVTTRILDLMLTTQQAAFLLGVNPKTLYNLVRDDETARSILLPDSVNRTPGGHARFRAADVKRYAEYREKQRCET